MDALFRKIWRFLESHSIWVFTATAAMTVFILFDPQCRQAWDIFFTRNKKVLDIYWQTLSFFLIILIPILGQSFKKLEEDFAGIGAKIFFEQVVCARKFWVLVPFSFLFFFAFPSEDFPLNQAVLTGIHYVLFVTWCFLFWKFFSLTKKSIEILVTRGKVIMKIFYDYLEGYQGNHKRQTKIGEDDSEEESWRLLWNIIDAQKEKWRKKFLGLFWSRLESLVVAKQYVSANDLLNDFAERYLELGTWDGKKRDQREHIHWMNARKRWLWFHEKQGSDGRENPFTVVSRLLDLHWQCWEALDGWEKPGNGTISDIETWGELYGLNSTLSNTLEKLFRDELDRTDDYYYSFFRCLTGFFDRVGEELLSDTVKYVRYLKIFPIYRPVFEAASKFDLRDYELQRGGSGFPNQWRMLLGYFEKKTLFTESKKSRGIQRIAWLNQFLSWSGSRIGHGKMDWDDTLDGALNMLFPEADASWMAWALAYRNLWLTGKHMESLCRWKKNFGDDPPYLFNMDGNLNHEEMYQRREELEKEEEKKRKDMAARVIQGCIFFDKSQKYMHELTVELRALEGKFNVESLEENNRQEILAMLEAVRDICPSVKKSN